jgi:hypothetical protein
MLNYFFKFSFFKKIIFKFLFIYLLGLGKEHIMLNLQECFFLFVKIENVKIIWINLYLTNIVLKLPRYTMVCLCAEFWDKLAATTTGSPHDVLRLTPGAVLGGYLGFVDNRRLWVLNRIKFQNQQTCFGVGH